MFILIVNESIILILMFLNRDQLIKSLEYILIESSKTESGRMNLLPIEKAINCCGATLNTASMYYESCKKNNLEQFVIF